MEFEIVAEPIKIRVPWKEALLVVIAIGGSTGMDYVIPASGSANTELNAYSEDLATKEYINVNYVSRDKLIDTVNNLQNQINSNTQATNDLKLEIKELSKKIDKILDRLPRKYDDGQ